LTERISSKQQQRPYGNKDRTDKKEKKMEHRNRLAKPKKKREASHKSRQYHRSRRVQGWDLSTFTKEMELDKLADRVAEVLQERNTLLIKQLVAKVGAEKAISCLQQTAQIESDGGMPLDSQRPNKVVDHNGKRKKKTEPNHAYQWWDFYQIST